MSRNKCEHAYKLIKKDGFVQAKCTRCGKIKEVDKSPPPVAILIGVLVVMGLIVFTIGYLFIKLLESTL